MTAANIIPTALTDGVVYSTAVPITSTEADLGDGLKTPQPIAVAEGQTIVVVVKLTINGHIVANSTMVFLQTDLGDNNWVDVAWIVWTGTDGTATFILCGGGLGAMNNAFQQSRQPSSYPGTVANGSNAVPLGGRVRITGFSKPSGGSSSLAGVSNAVLATITYRLQEPR